MGGSDCFYSEIGGDACGIPSFTFLLSPTHHCQQFNILVHETNKKRYYWIETFPQALLVGWMDFFQTLFVVQTEYIVIRIIWLQDEPSKDCSVPPKVDSEVEVLDENVSKQILKEGHSSKPSKYSTCFLFLWVMVQEQNHIEFVLGKGMWLSIAESA
ncbi:hypothetical protein N665_0122s0057 [Sinapis alba]|nr:hypothetical protein N665_0122s0057 [Sinapis alba]